MNKFNKIYLPDNYILIYEITSNCLIFHLLLHSNDICVAPKLLTSVVVHDELKISAFALKAALSMHTGCFTIIETKRQLLKPLPMTLFFFCFQIVIAK